MKLKYFRFGNKGISLVEIMLTVMILGVGISGTFMLLTASMVSSQTSWDMTVATTHAEYVLENIQTLNSTEDALVINWAQWLSMQEAALLPQEAVEVVVKNGDDDSMEIEVVIRWIRKKRESKVSLVTRLVK